MSPLVFSLVRGSVLFCIYLVIAPIYLPFAFKEATVSVNILFALLYLSKFGSLDIGGINDTAGDCYCMTYLDLWDVFCS